MSFIELDGDDCEEEGAEGIKEDKDEEWHNGL